MFTFDLNALQKEVSLNFDIALYRAGIFFITFIIVHFYLYFADICRLRRRFDQFFNWIHI